MEELKINICPVRQFACPSLNPPIVELTAEREQHIETRHPDLLPAHCGALESTLRDPDGISPDRYNPGKRSIFKWFPEIRGGKFVVVQVVTDWGEPDRYWIVTAYLDSIPPS